MKYEFFLWGESASKFIVQRMLPLNLVIISQISLTKMSSVIGYNWIANYLDSEGEGEYCDDLLELPEPGWIKIDD